MGVDHLLEESDVLGDLAADLVTWLLCAQVALDARLLRLEVADKVCLLLLDSLAVFFAGVLLFGQLHDAVHGLGDAGLEVDEGRRHTHDDLMSAADLIFELLDFFFEFVDNYSIAAHSGCATHFQQGRALEAGEASLCLKLFATRRSLQCLLFLWSA